jgi:hypothetical protein
MARTKRSGLLVLVTGLMLELELLAALKLLLPRRF